MVLLAALSGVVVNWHLPGDAKAQSSVAVPVGQSALLEAGGRTIGGPAVEVVGQVRVYGGDGLILDTCQRDAGGVSGDCEPLDVCVTLVNLGTRPVAFGLYGQPGDVLVLLSRVVPQRSQTSCARGVVSVDLNPVAQTDSNFGSVAEPVEVVWRIDVMPSPSEL
jgi:hypothetical protein